MTQLTEKEAEIKEQLKNVWVDMRRTQILEALNYRRQLRTLEHFEGVEADWVADLTNILENEDDVVFTEKTEGMAFPYWILMKKENVHAE